jgi:predicted DNA-binding protein (MmcQ/YjbR family)
VTGDELRDWCLSMPGAIEDFPFAPRVWVFKVAGKVFAVTPLATEPLTVSVKCDPALAESLSNSYTSIVPGYHLNKRHWLTVTLNEDAATTWFATWCRTATTWSSQDARAGDPDTKPAGRTRSLYHRARER